MKNNRKTNNHKKHIRWGRVGILIGAFILMMSWAITAFADSYDDYDCTHVVIHSGDTLWNLIQEVNPDYSGNMNEAIYQTCKLNNMSSSALRTGNTILIPHLD